MSRSGRRALTTVIAVAITIASALVIVGIARASARSDARCWWEGTTLYATGLPDEWSLTFTLVPTGTTNTSPTYEQTFASVRTAYFWTRKGPGAKDAPRPPRQMRDYKVVAWC